MAPKGGTAVLLLLILTHAALAKNQDNTALQAAQIKNMAKSLMIKCLNTGNNIPMIPQMTNLLSGSNKMLTQTPNLLSEFVSVVSFLPGVDANKTLRSSSPTTEAELTMSLWNCTYLQSMIKLIRNSSDSSTCFIKAFVAPFSWMMLTSSTQCDMDSEAYGNMLWAAKPLLQNMPPANMNLPPIAQFARMKEIMTMLKEVFGSLSGDQRKQIVKWAKEQVSYNYFNCIPYTVKPTPTVAKSCPSNLEWLRKDIMTLLGPYLSCLESKDVDTISKVEMCLFFNTSDFKTSFMEVGEMDSSLARSFLKRVRECFTAVEFAARVDRLGVLSCIYDDTTAMNTTLKGLLLSQLGECKNSDAKKLKNQLVQSLMSSSPSGVLRNLGPGMTVLTPEQLSKFSVTDLKEALKSLGPNAKWKLNQAKELAKTLLAGKQVVNSTDLLSLGSAVRGVLLSVLRNASLQDILGKGDLKNITKEMSRGQRKALLEGLRGENASELVRKISGPLLSSVSLNILNKANLTSLDQVEGKDWSQAQSAFLLRRLMGNTTKPSDIRKLGSAIQGMVCRMIDRVSNNDSMEMAQTMSETPQWLSKTQVICAAQKLFRSLEQQRPGYFQSITQEELNEIPTLFLIQLQPPKIRDLPDSVCIVFLDKMRVANLSSLPPTTPSRPALTDRALRCLTNGSSISVLSGEDMLNLGPLLCEVPPSQLSLLAPEALNPTLRSMASCLQIPPQNMMNLSRLLYQTYGDPSNWTVETMQSLGRLLVLDAAAVRDLRPTSGLMEVLTDLKDRLSNGPSSSTPDLSALRKKLFSLITLSTPPTGARRRRAVVSPSIPIPSEEMIQQLGEANVYWSPEQLKNMTVATFLATADVLGLIKNYNQEQLAALAQKAKESGLVTGPSVNESVVIQLGCICQGFPNADLGKFAFTLQALDAVDSCGWNQTQREAIWMSYCKTTKQTPQTLTAADIVGLGQFICGLSSDDIKNLDTGVFREAADAMGNVQCSPSVTELFKALAVTVFGQPSTWTEAVTATLGNIIAGLNATELASLEPPVFSFVNPSTVALIPPVTFAALSIGQLTALGPDNAAMVTAAQRSALGQEKLDALTEALVGFRNEPLTPTPAPLGAGAPSLSIEGMAALVKPLLFLLLGILLL